MKKQQLAVLLLSALSAGIVIGCSKPNDSSTGLETPANGKSNTADVDMSAKTATDSQQSAEAATSTGSNTSVQAIELSKEATNAYLQQVAKTQIIPVYQNVAKQSRQFDSLAADYCQLGTLNNEHVQLLRAQWLALATAWAAAEVVNFGPAMDSMSNLYINYYPDERGMVHQGVIDLIQNNPALTPEQLSAESAIVQGLPGIEDVLYRNETLDVGQCQYVMSASAALKERLTQVEDDWQTASQQLLGMGDMGDDAPNIDGISSLGMNRWINSLLALVETTKSRSLEQPLGLSGHKKGHLPAAAAGQSRAIIAAKMAVLNKALTDPALVALLAQHGHDTISDELSTVLAQITALLAQLPEDIGDAKPAQQQALYDKMTKLTQVIKHKLMPILGVQVGFNSTDGD